MSQLVKLPLNRTLAAITALILCGTSGLSVSLMGDQDCHKCWIGLRSELWLGHLRTLTLSSVNHFCAAFTACLGSRSPLTFLSTSLPGLLLGCILRSWWCHHTSCGAGVLAVFFFVCFSPLFNGFLLIFQTIYTKLHMTWKMMNQREGIYHCLLDQ